jgi:hypothetical protein
MTQEVFNGLVQVFCELYLDDLIVFSATEDECIHHLRTVFQRCRDKGLTLHPDKCKFGLSEVEYVGHKLDSQGVHFSREKLDSILNFKKPKSHKEMKSFLGFANYFRDHISNYSTLSRPLHKMVEKYKPSNVLKWNDNLQLAFDILLTAVHECPKLYFLDETSPIFLHTDASNYGIGAYLFQVRDGKNYPIAFLSKSLDDRMCRWDTAQKEGYAIFFAFDKWDHLLRNRNFTLRTDHDNLLRLKETHASNKKVQRWLTAFQHYDYVIEHIAGKLNIEADTFSRLCPEIVTNEPTIIALNAAPVSVSNEAYTKIVKVHNDTIGHSSIKTMFRLLKDSKQTWKGMSKDIKNFKSLCPSCQKNNQHFNKNIAFPFKVHGNSLMEKVDIDFIVGLRPDDKGVDTILVIIDSFSRWVHLFPMVGLSAINAAEAIINHCGIFGVPKRFTHDNDRVLISEIVKQTVAILGTKADVTLAYSKEEQAIVERANKEVMKHLRNFIFDNMAIKCFSRYIPLVQRIMNSSTHKVTGFSPSILLFGHSLDLNRNLIAENPTLTTQNISYNQWIQEVKDMQLFALGIAKQNLHKASEIHFENYPANQTVFENGTYVLVEHVNPFRRGPKSKLLPFLKGPFLVISSTKSRYTLRNVLTNRIKDYHVKRLSPFRLDPTRSNPIEVALRDDGELFIINNITRMRGSAKGPKAQLFFEVFWLGFKDPTWEPWSRVRTTLKLHEFLRAHKTKAVQNLVPINYTEPNDQIFSDSDAEDSDTFSDDESSL